MAKMNYKGKPVHVYVMRTTDNLVKVGISENVVLRMDNERFEGEKKKIVTACYSSEKIDIKTARIYEAALLGFHRKYIINGSEWLTAQWKSVVGTLNSILNGKILRIQVDESDVRQKLNDQYMKNKGYTRKYLGKFNRCHYLKYENGMCYLVNQATAGVEEKIICSLPVEEMMDYLTENGMQLVEKL